MSRKKEQPSMSYPVFYGQLEAGDPGYDHGYRYMLEQVDGDRHFFRTRDGVHGSDRFAAIHSMQPITPEEFQQLRDAHAAHEGEGSDDD